jgi:hypothetical protein
MARSKKAKKKHDELLARSPPLRAEALKPKVEARHEAAEHRAQLQTEHRRGRAARHNLKAETLPLEVAAARAAAAHDQRLHDEMRQLRATAVHEDALQARRTKGATEVNKVQAALFFKELSDANMALENGRLQDERMAAAEERHAAELERVAARGLAESEKVERATRFREAEVEGKRERYQSEQAAAAERRAARLGQIAAKGAVEAAKVHKVSGPWRGGLRSAAPETIDADEEPPLASPATVSARRQRAPGLVAREADLLLLLMRGGAPNLEVLNARSTDEYLQIASKYQIDVGVGGRPSHLVASPIPLAAL